MTLGNDGNAPGSDLGNPGDAVPGHELGEKMHFGMEEIRHGRKSPAPDGFPWVITGRKGPWGLRPILSVPGSGQVRLFFLKFFGYLSDRYHVMVSR